MITYIHSIYRFFKNRLLIGNALTPQPLLNSIVDSVITALLQSINKLTSIFAVQFVFNTSEFNALADQLEAQSAAIKVKLAKKFAAFEAFVSRKYRTKQA